MTGKFFTSVAAGAIFATASVLAPAAFAQNAAPAAGNDTPSTTQTAPAANDAMKPAAPAGSAQSDAPAAGATTAQAGSYLTQQSPDQVSANTYIGQSVYNGNNESIGKVNDLIMQKQGGIVAAVVGVGGFLGIGEKNVAVPISNITVAQNSTDGTVKLTTTESVDSLKSAPEFKTLEMQSAAKAPSTTGAGMTGTDTTSTGSTTNK
jgi:sporulation protein YlmC with PRC-barrel domain